MDTDTESCFKVPKFHDETVISTPLPQASSTVDKRPDLVPEKELAKRPSEDSGRGSGFLSDGILSLNKMQEELRAVLENQAEAVKKSEKTSHVSNISEPEQYTSLQVHVPSDGMDKHLTKSEPILKKVVEDPEQRNIMKLSTIPEFSKEDNRNASLPLLSTNKPEIDFDRRATYTYRDDEIDLERQNAREKALKALAYDDLHLEIPRPEATDSKVSSFSLDNLGHLSLPLNNSKNEEVSGFSDLIHESDLHREEELCAENYLPLKPNEVSFSDSKNFSMMTQYFDRGTSDSFWEFLGPSHHESMTNSSKEKGNSGLKSVDLLSSVPSVSKKDASVREISSKDASTGQKQDISAKHNKENNINCSQLTNISKISSVSHNLNDLKSTSLAKSKRVDGSSVFPSPSFMDDSLSHEIPRMSEIAQVLKDTDVEATPISLVKKVLATQQQKSATRDESIYNSRNLSDCSSISLNTTSSERHYEIKVVYGGGTELLLYPQFGFHNTIWTAQPDSDKVVCKIKENPPSSVNIIMFPKAKEDIEVKIIEVSMDRSLHIFHNISLKVELPKVKFDGFDVFDFNRVPECSISKIPFKISCSNNNMVVISVHIKDSQSDMLSIEFDEPCTQMIDLFPDNPLTGSLILKPKYGFCKDPRKIVHWESAIQICLVQLLNLEVICEVKVKAKIFRSTLQISLPNNTFMCGEEKDVALRNLSPCDVEIDCNTSGRFIVFPSNITIPSNSVGSVRIEYAPIKPANCEAELVFTSKPGSLSHIIKLIGKSDGIIQRIQSSNVAEFLPPFSSQPLCTSSANSSISIGGSSYEVDGPLQLLCSQTCLVWPSRTVGCDSPFVKTVLFTKKTETKEKLIFEIIDPSGSFQLVCDGKRRSSLVTTVSNSTRREIYVDFTPRRSGQIKGQISIKRVTSDACKKTIDLYGFGGNGRLQAENVDIDLENKSFQVTVSHVDKRGQFILQNVGDGTAFFNIFLRSARGMFVEVSPTRGLINPGEKMTVTISLDLDHIGPALTSIQDILRKNKNPEILLLNLYVVFGDQPTRLRICRIYKKYKKEPELLKAPLVSATMESLCNIFPTDKSDKQLVSQLKDPLKSVWDLFEKGINEWSIGVAVSRNVLEEIVLDTSQQFVSLLENPTFDETECSTFFENSLLHSSQRF